MIEAESDAQWMLRVRGLSVGSSLTELPSMRGGKVRDWIIVGVSEPVDSVSGQTIQLQSLDGREHCSLKPSPRRWRRFVSADVVACAFGSHRRAIRAAPKSSSTEVVTAIQDSNIFVRATDEVQNLPNLERARLHLNVSSVEALRRAAPYLADKSPLDVAISDQTLSDTDAEYALLGIRCRAITVSSHYITGDFLSRLDCDHLELLSISGRRCDLTRIDLRRMGRINRLALPYGYGGVRGNARPIPPSLKSLDLSFRTDACAVLDVFELSTSELETLAVDGGSQVGEGNALVIPGALRNLSMAFTDLSDQGLRRLAEIEHLQSVCVYASKVSVAGLATVRAIRPDCDWSYW